MILGFEKFHLIILCFTTVLCLLGMNTGLKSLSKSFLVFPPLFMTFISGFGLFFSGNNEALSKGPSLFFVFSYSLLISILFLFSKLDEEHLRKIKKSIIIYIFSIWAIMTENIIIFSLFWIVSFLPILKDLEKENIRRKFVFLIHHIGSTLFLVIGLIILSTQKGNFYQFSDLNFALIHDYRTKIAALCLIIATLIRQGFFPFHLWVKSSIDLNPYPIKMTFYFSNLGFVLFYKLVIPLISFDLSDFFHFMAYYAIFSAFYFSNLSFVQQKVRMSLLYIMLSHFSILISGLVLNTDIGKASVFFQFMSIGFCFCGLFSMVYLFEEYVGVMSTNTFYGFKKFNPYLSGMFLLFALCSVGLPMSMNFIGEDLLFHTVIEHYPILGCGIVISAAFNGMMIYRIYSYMFGGKWNDFFDNHVLLTSKQKFALSVLIIFLFVLGVFPQLLLKNILHFI